MPTSSQPNEETQELKRLFHQTKRTFSRLNYNDLTDESVRSVLSTIAGYETNQENPPFSINDAKDLTASLINVSNLVQDPKYRDNSKI